MLCSNCGYNNAAAASDTAPCAFCGYLGHDTETVAEAEPAAAIPAFIPAPAIPAISEAVEAPAPLFGTVDPPAIHDGL